MSSGSPRGILRNKSVSDRTVSHEERLNRQEVINNTRLNAQVAETRGDKIRAKIAELKKEDDNEPTPDREGDHLKWDELNLYQTEQEKNSTMKIDEPKTPYEGGFNPEGEYYKDDDEDAIPEFELGAGELDIDHTRIDSLNGGEVLKNENEEEEEEEEEKVETAEERHKRFEDMRKKHYHLKGDALKHKIDIPDEDE